MDQNYDFETIDTLCAIASNYLVYSNEVSLLHLQRKRKKETEIAVIQSFLLQRKVIPRGIWVKAKSTGWYNYVVPRMTQIDFVSYFRMPRTTLEQLVILLEPQMKKSDEFPRKSIDFRKRICIGLHCLSSCAEIKTIASLFGVGTTTALECFMDFVSAVCAIIAPEFIKWPSTPEQFQNNASKFENLWQFPMTVAAIDGCHLSISPPKENTTDYYNFKGWHSIIAFAACDADGKVVYLRSGIPGRANDSTIFMNSSLYRKIADEKCLPPSQRIIQGVTIPYNILGDSAFRLDTWLLKPYTHRRNLSPDETRFNYRLSRARRIVENLFERVKGRWRRVLKRQESNLENANKIIIAAFAMHNFCEDYRAPVDSTWDDEVLIQEIEMNTAQPNHLVQDTNNNPTAEQIRTALMVEFRENRLGWEAI